MTTSPDPEQQKLGFLRGILVWTYSRGTWQYDILCALILAFVFFMPLRCFAPRKPPVISPGAPAAGISEPAPAKPADLRSPMPP